MTQHTGEQVLVTVSLSKSVFPFFLIIILYLLIIFTFFIINSIFTFVTMSIIVLLLSSAELFMSCWLPFSWLIKSLWFTAALIAVRYRTVFSAQWVHSSSSYLHTLSYILQGPPCHSLHTYSSSCSFAFSYYYFTLSLPPPLPPTPPPIPPLVVPW
jgi:hypothetical protein